MFYSSMLLRMSIYECFKPHINSNIFDCPALFISSDTDAKGSDLREWEQKSRLSRSHSW